MEVSGELLLREAQSEAVFPVVFALIEFDNSERILESDNRVLKPYAVLFEVGGGLGAIHSKSSDMIVMVSSRNCNLPTGDKKPEVGGGWLFAAKPASVILESPPTETERHPWTSFKT